MVTTDLKETFFSLVRLGIGNASVVQMPEQIDWNELEDLAAKQGLSAAMVDGIEKLPENQRPPKLILLQWIGEALLGSEYQYELYCRAIAKLAGFYNEHGFKMMVLKGYACSLDWPKPKHRPCGDIDIWLFGKCHEADALLVKEKGVEIDSSHHHHTVFRWRDFIVENHYDFVNAYAHKSNQKLEKVLKNLGQNDSYFVELYGEKVYLPSPDLHALFLIRHAALHFAAEGVTLRQILDWAFFVKKHTQEINWKWLLEILEKFHMMDFYNCINAICVEDLGFESSIFPSVQFLPSMKDRVLQDILSPKYQHEPPAKFIPRLIFKWKRWKDNEWKRELCYAESHWSTFWNGIWAKVLKPASI